MTLDAAPPMASRWGLQENSESFKNTEFTFCNAHCGAHFLKKR